MGNTPAVRSRRTVDLGGERTDRVFDGLGHSYRRFVLWYLDEAGGRSTVPQLSRELDAWQSRRDAPNEGVTGVATIALSLRHTHLPKLEDASLIAFDSGSSTVTLLDAAPDALDHLDVVRST